MSSVFLKLLNMSVTAMYLVFAILILRFLFKKAPKWITCSLWGLVGLRLICPFSFESIFSLIPTKEFLPGETVNSFSSFTPTIPEVFEYAGKNPVSYDLVIDKNASVVFSEISAPDNTPYLNPLLIITTILSVIWVIGIIGMLIYTLISYLRIHKRIREAVRVEGNIFVCDRIDTPFILGIFRPRIYIPSGMNEEDRQYVIAHEKAHIKRLDHLWKPFGFLILSVYWFNPVLWLAYVLLCRDIEFACDEKVIKTMGKEIKKPYSTALINCSTERKMIAACPVAFGETGVKARIKSVLSYKKPAFWVIIISLVVCIAVAVCFGTNPKTTTLPDGIFYAEGNDIMYPYIDISTEDKTISQGMSIWASYADRFTYKETAGGIEIYDYEGNKTDHTIKVQEDGVIFDGVGYIRSEDYYFDEAVKNVLFEENSAIGAECLTEGHIVLGRDIRRNSEKIYIIANLCAFNFVNSDFSAYRGEPYVLMVMERKGGEYSSLGTVYPTVGEYENAVRNMFPKKYWEAALNLSEDDHDNLWFQCKEQAKDYLRRLGRTAIVTERKEEEETSISEIGVSSERVLRILSDARASWSDFNDYIGSKEVIEGDRRYVYRTVHEKESQTLVFTKEDPLNSDEILLFRRIEISTDKDLGEMPYSLRTIYPEYYSLPTDNGLTVYVWKKNNTGDYYFGLTVGHNKNDITDKLNLKAVSLSDMREIISSYNIEENDIKLVPINHPLSSYYWDYDKEFDKKEESMVKGMLCAYLTERPEKSLSEEEYKYLTEDFFGDSTSSFNIARQFLASSYDDVRYIDLYSLFYNGIPGGKNAGQKEIELLGGNDTCPYSSFSEKDMNKVMKKYTGVSLKDTNKKNIGKMDYLKEYDSYYIQHGDSYYPSPEFKGGYSDSEGFICLLYDADSYVILRKTQSGEYFIVRNCNPDYDLFWNSYLPGSSPEEASLEIRTESYNGDSESYDRREWLDMSHWQKKYPNKSFENKKITVVCVNFSHDVADSTGEFEVFLNEEKVEKDCEVLGCIGLPFKSDNLKYATAEIALLCSEDYPNEQAERAVSKNIFIRYSEK